jgi:hypothetical protein
MTRYVVGALAVLLLVAAVAQLPGPVPRQPAPAFRVSAIRLPVLADPERTGFLATLTARTFGGWFLVPRDGGLAPIPPAPEGPVSGWSGSDVLRGAMAYGTVPAGER